jgi:tetratricopeptide (TPR) repeat protein
LKILDPKANPVETANALAIEARFHHLAGRHKKAIELLLEAANLVAPTAARDTVSSFDATIIPLIYAYIAGAHQHYGLFLDADSWARKAIEFGERHKIPSAEAMGYEFLGEDAVNEGDYEAGLKYARHEREIATRLHSRERRAWTHFVVAHCSSLLGRLDEAVHEYVEGIALADAIGEQRLKMLLKSNVAVPLAELGRLDEALQTAEETMSEADALGLLYSRFEALRCLATVRFMRAKGSVDVSKQSGMGTFDHRELDEAEHLCATAHELINSSEARLCRLWLGPLHISVLLAQGKLEEAKEKLVTYQALVADCQSPRFTKEAELLTASLQ